MLERKLISLTLCAMMLLSSCIILTSNAQAGGESGWNEPIVLEKGMEGVRAAGFFGEDWGVASGDFSWGGGGQ